MTQQPDSAATRYREMAEAVEQRQRRRVGLTMRGPEPSPSLPPDVELSNEVEDLMDATLAFMLGKPAATSEDFDEPPQGGRPELD